MEKISHSLGSVALWPAYLGRCNDVIDAQISFCKFLRSLLHQQFISFPGCRALFARTPRLIFMQFLLSNKNISCAC